MAKLGTNIQAHSGNVVVWCVDSPTVVYTTPNPCVATKNTDQKANAIKGMLRYISEGWIRSDFYSLDNNIPGGNHASNLLRWSHFGKMLSLHAPWKLNFRWCSYWPYRAVSTELHFQWFLKRLMLLCPKALKPDLACHIDCFDIVCSTFNCTPVRKR